MPNYGQSAKQRKMNLVYQTIKHHTNGITEQEIADELEMGDKRRTINNYLRELELQGKIYKEDQSTLWYALPFDSVKLRGIEMSPEEAMTLYLAVRLLVKQHDKQNDAAQLALTRLAEVLTGDARVGHEIYQAALELSRRPGDEAYARIFRTMMQGYIYRRKVTITYKPLNAKAFDTTFSPYLFEPSAIGYATYAIGHSSIVNARRTYKLERIQHATLTREEYVIPADFPGLEILRNAWSIIHGENLVPVKLRFSPEVAERVRESQWHPSQKPVVDDPDKSGWIVWEAQVADTTDLKPWVRSWGSDCEALEPEALRNALKREARRLAELYGVVAGNNPEQYYAHSRPDLDESEWQLLIDHLQATAEIAFELGADAGVSELAKTAGLLHDIGKYSKEFQARLRGSNRRVDHATAGAKEIVKLFPDDPFAEILSYCIAGHHTGLPDYGSMSDTADNGTLLARREKKELKNYDTYKTEINAEMLALPRRLVIPARFRMDEREKAYTGFSIAFLTRMIFSALVDADWLETERYMQDEKNRAGNTLTLPPWPNSSTDFCNGLTTRKTISTANGRKP